MKKILCISTTLIVMMFFCLGTAYADEEGSIDQLLTDYEAAYREKNVTKVKAFFYKSYFQIYYDAKGKIMTWSPADGDKYWKDTESFFSSMKSYKMTNRQITIDQNIAYVRCEETQSYKKGNVQVLKTMITLMKERGRWYIAVIVSQDVTSQ